MITFCHVNFCHVFVTAFFSIKTMNDLKGSSDFSRTFFRAKHFYPKTCNKWGDENCRWQLFFYVQWHVFVTIFLSIKTTNYLRRLFWLFRIFNSFNYFFPKKPLIKAEQKLQMASACSYYFMPPSWAGLACSGWCQVGMGGTPLSVLQELGGWHSPQMVQKYAHLSPAHLADAAEKVTLWWWMQTDKSGADWYIFVTFLSQTQKQRSHLMGGFVLSSWFTYVFWLLELGSNQWPTD